MSQQVLATVKGYTDGSLWLDFEKTEILGRTDEKSEAVFRRKNAWDFVTSQIQETEERGGHSLIVFEG